MMQKYRTVFAFICGILLLQSCTFLPKLEEPGIAVSSVKLLDSTGLTQRFRIGLSLTNPNRVALPINGMSYTLSLNGYDLIKGVSADIPTLQAYSETPVVLEGTADLFEALRLLNSLMREAQPELEYRLAAKLDVQGWRPNISVSRSGVVELAR